MVAVAQALSRLPDSKVSECCAGSPCGAKTLMPTGASAKRTDALKGAARLRLVRLRAALPLLTGRPGPLLGLAPLGTGRASLPASGSSKPSRSIDVRPYDPFSIEWIVLGSVHHDRGRGA